MYVPVQLGTSLQPTTISDAMVFSPSSTMGPLPHNFAHLTQNPRNQARFSFSPNSNSLEGVDSSYRWANDRTITP